MISDALVKLIQDSEGFSTIPYKDSIGVPTIGFGFTHYVDGTPVSMQDAPIGRDYAITILNGLLQQFVNGVEAMVASAGLNQNQKDALTDFAYNLGLGSLKSSTLLKLVLQNPSNPEISDEFAKWVYAGHEILPGLVKRRAAESQLYFTPIQNA